MLASWKKSYDKPRQHIKKQRHHFANKVHLVKAMVFLVVTYGCESLTTEKAEHRRTDAYELWCWEKALESPLHYKEIKPVSLKGNQPRIFTGKTDAEAEAPILRLPDMKSDSLAKTLMLVRLRAGEEGGGRE